MDNLHCINSKKMYYPLNQTKIYLKNAQMIHQVIREAAESY